MKRLLGWVAIAALVAFVLSHAPRGPAPDATFVTLKGEKVSLSQLRGKVVIVNFWATDCPICNAEMPQMVETFNRYRERGLEFIAVAMPYDPPNYVLAYVEREKLPFKVALDPMAELVRRFGDVKATPTTFVIDKRGEIVEQIVGAADFPKLQRLLEEKLAEPDTVKGKG
ncbi:MAG TPA: TlpA disulfide reductase family protein [Burkholderiales bacterium]|nr:TlpA disulfide reductase family protein [Burkholderiales bacterium]